MSIKESALSAITSITQADFIRVVTSAGASRRISFANLMKGYSKTIEVVIPAGGSKTLTAESYTPYMITFHGYTGGTRGALVGISDTSTMLVYNWLGVTPADIEIVSVGTRQIKITNNGQYQTNCYVTVYKNSITVA